MKLLSAICVLIAAHSAFLPGQTVNVPAKWIGTWALNNSKSTFGTILVPGIPADLAVVGQSLTLEQVGQAIRITGDTVTSDKSGSRSSHDDHALSLDGKQTTVGPISLSFRPIDDSTFEIVSRLVTDDFNLEEVSRFSFSLDGETLTETKTQKTDGPEAKTSTTVLVFSRIRFPRLQSR